MELSLENSAAFEASTSWQGPTIFKYGKPSPLALTFGNGWFADDSDYVVIQLSKPIGQPLKIAKSIVPGEILYHLGYASCTGCDRAHNLIDPKLEISRGH